MRKRCLREDASLEEITIKTLLKGLLDLRAPRTAEPLRCGKEEPEEWKHRGAVTESGSGSRAGAVK